MFRFMRLPQLGTTALVSLLLALPSPATAMAKSPLPAPNIVLIVADDMGYSDLGVFGGEIATPNLDTLARAGVQLTNFHAAPTCSPTRSMLLTGTDNHTAGVGAMAEVESAAMLARFGYEGRLTNRVATVAERLRAAGYFTVMVGKWHLGMQMDSVPSARGFDKSFALLQGAHNHFGKGGFGPETSERLGATYLDDGKIATVPDDFYSSDYFTTRLLDKLAAADSRKPFLAYLAFSAPHAPLQAPAALIEKYRGRYDGGWEVLRRERLARMKALGVIPGDTVAHDIIPDALAWEKLSADERQVEARKMEIYAAMVERLDWNVGRLVEQLQRDGRYQNTIFIFTSDNGPAGETGQTFGIIPGELDYINGFDNSLANMGSASSFVFYGEYWAQSGSAPFQLYKSFVTEGGTRVPAFITYANRQRQPSVSNAYANVMDVTPTVLDMAAAPVTDRVDGHTVAPIKGRSMLQLLTGKARSVHAADEPIAFELHGQRSVTQGQWKLTYVPKPMGSGTWQLFDIANDPAERNDVGASHPDLRQQLIIDWGAYAKSVQIPTQ
jgi:arylsulfatase